MNNQTRNPPPSPGVENFKGSLGTTSRAYARGRPAHRRSTPCRWHLEAGRVGLDGNSIRSGGRSSRGHLADELARQIRIFFNRARVGPHPPLISSMRRGEEGTSQMCNQVSHAMRTRAASELAHGPPHYLIDQLSPRRDNKRSFD